MEKLKQTSWNSCSVLIGHKLYAVTEGKLKAHHSKHDARKIILWWWHFPSKQT